MTLQAERAWLRPVLAWAASLALSVGLAVIIVAHGFSPSLWWNAMCLVAIPAALWALLGIWIARQQKFWRPALDVVGAAVLALLLASNWAPLHVVLISSVVAGLSYWILAGMPRPPYADR